MLLTMTHFQRYKFILLFLLLGSSLAQALTLHQNITVDINGGAMISYAYYVPVKSLWLVRMMHQKLGIPDFTSRETVQRHFEGQTGVKLESYFTSTRGSNSITQFTVRVDNAAEALASGIFGKLKIAPSEKISGDLECTAVLPGPSEASVESSSLLRQLGGLEMTLRLTTPTEIIESTGQKEAFNRHSWKVGAQEILQGRFPDVRACW